MARCFALGAEAPHVKTADTNLDCVLVNMSFFKLIVDAENPREKNRVIGQTWRGRNPGSAMPTIWRSSISSPGGPPGTLEPEKAPLLSSTPPSHASNCLQLPPAAGSPPPPTPPPPCQRLETQREPGNEENVGNRGRLLGGGARGFGPLPIFGTTKTSTFSTNAHQMQFASIVLDSVL